MVARSSSVWVIASLNPTSAHLCGEVTGCMMSAKRSVHVVPEVDLGKVHHIHLRKKVNKAEPTLTLKPRGDITRNPKEG